MSYAIHKKYGTIKKIPDHTEGWMDKSEWSIYNKFPTEEIYFKELDNLSKEEQMETVGTAPKLTLAQYIELKISPTLYDFELNGFDKTIEHFKKQLQIIIQDWNLENENREDIKLGYFIFNHHCGERVTREQYDAYEGFKQVLPIEIDTKKKQARQETFNRVICKNCKHWRNITKCCEEEDLFGCIMLNNSPYRDGTFGCIKFEEKEK